VLFRLGFYIIYAETRVVIVRRICKRCGGEFTFEYFRGRPREYCTICQPPGTRQINAVRKAAA
jgi:ribosomal protein S27AE